MKMKYTVLEGRREGSNFNELWVVIGNEYIDPDIYDGVVSYGFPVVELLDPIAIQSKIDAINYDIDVEKDESIDLPDADIAIAFLKSYL